jgi:hypothetical protein
MWDDQRKKLRNPGCEYPAALICDGCGHSLFVDSGAEFCQAVIMFRLSRKFVAVLLTIWLPLFSGNALAASIAMQLRGGDCHVVQPDVAQQSSHHSNHVSSMHHQVQLAADQPAAHQEQQGHQHNQQTPSHKNCGVCQLACCGYLAAVTIEVAEAQPLAQSFLPSSTQFQSITSTPLDPPPLAHV